MASEFSRVVRPIGPRPRAGGLESRDCAIRDTLATGDAVAVPLNGEPAAVVRNRIAVNAYRMAYRLNARARTRISDDNLALLVWLEPK